MLVLASRPPVVPPTERLDSTVGMTLPILAYQIRGEAMVAVLKAERILVARCMARFGFPDPLAWLPLPTVGPPQESRRYGIFDLAMAQQWGYHVPPGSIAAAQRNRPTRSVAEEFVLSGSQMGQRGQSAGGAHNGIDVPAGGCYGEAQRRLAPSGKYGVDADLVRRINGSTQAATDPLVVQVIADWAQCMRRKGFDRTNPVRDPKTDPAINPDAKPMGPTPTLEEIQEAVGDVVCKKETNLVGVWFAVESAYQTAMIEENVATLAEIQDNNDAIIRAAAEVVAAGS